MYEQGNFKHYYSGSLTSLCCYEFMIELGPLITKCQIKKSQFCVASPHLLRLGEGALQVEVPAMNCYQRYKQPNRSQLGHQRESIRIIHPISLGIPFSNKAGFQPSNGSIRINLLCKHPMTTNDFLPSR